MTDIYAQDTSQMRYHLVHMVVEVMPRLENVDQTITLLEALAAYIKAGNPVIDDEPDEKDDPGPTSALNPRGYL